MYARYFILVLCLFLLGGSLHAKRNSEWEKHSTTEGGSATVHTDSRSHSKLHDLQNVKPSETINIDDHPPQSDVYMGSGDQPVDDENDPSGDGLDDEDTEGSAGPRHGDDEDEGSADGYVKSPCQKLKAELNARKVIGAYTPRCTLGGAFEKMQCSGTGECWCVDEMGRELTGTRMQDTKQPDCEQDIPIIVGRNKDERRPEPKDPYIDTNTNAHIPPTDPIEDSEESEVIDNAINNMPGSSGPIEIQTMAPPDSNKVEMLESKANKMLESNVVMTQPGILAGIIGGAVVGLLCAVLLVMFIVYRMRKKDEGSYALDEPRRSPSLHTYSRATNREFYA